MARTIQQALNVIEYEARPGCDWNGLTNHPCTRKASFKWGDRYICANHAASWIRVGKTMQRLPGVKNPWPGSWLWDRTEEPT